MKQVFIVLLLVVGLGWLLSRSLYTTPKKETAKKVSVSASFYPLGEFTRQVGGDSVETAVIVPPGVEPHEYEPSPRDIATIRESDVFVYNGGGIDAWAEKLQPELEQQHIVVVHMSSHIELTERTDAKAESDLHFWLDPVLARKEVEIVRDTLVTVDPEHESAYKKNADTYLLQLIRLDEEYRTGLTQCVTGTVVTSHAAFGYLAKRYNLQQVAISGLSPEEEPSPKRIAEIAAFAKEHKVQYIFFETLVSSKVAQTIAGEIGAKIAVFNPLEGLTQEEISGGKNYLSVMRENLSRLRTALSCT